MRDWKGAIPSLESLQPFGDDGLPRELRKHQREAYERAMLLVSGGSADRTTTAEVTPGGGKTLLASIFAQVLLRAGFVSRVVFVVPRDSLREQTADSFCDPVRGLDLRIVPISSRPDERTMFANAGYVTTYQGMGRSSAAHLRALGNERILLVLDEVHHLVDEYEGWVGSVRQVADRAHHVLVVSGNLQRHDRKKVPFVTYADKKVVTHIKYTRLDALEERAIIPLDVELLDADTTFMHKGERHEVTLSTAKSRKDERRAIRTALAIDEFKDRLLTRAFASWQDYRSVYYHSKMIVVCEDQAEARNVAAYIRKAHPAYDVALAISDEPNAHAAIRKFRKASHEVLVTCQMAYEGLDVPEATHMVYLHRIRSFPWMEQATARTTRFNPRCGLAWKDQAARVFAPGDKSWRTFVDKLKEEQGATYVEHMRGALDRRPIRRSSFSPVDATPTTVDIGGERGLPSPELQAVVRRMLDRHPELDRMPHRVLIEMAEEMMRDSGRAT